MFGLLGVVDAMRGGWFGAAPVVIGQTESVAFMYTCERCDVSGRCETEGDARCWLCGTADVSEYRSLVKDQRSLSGEPWTVLPEPCERLVERSDSCP